MDKSSLRARYKRLIERIGEENRRAQSLALSQKLTPYLKSQSGTWTLYSPLNDEPNLLSLMKECSHIQWVFPKVESKTKMSFFPVRGLDQMVCSSWGIEEPRGDLDSPISMDEISGCLIPGIAYNRQGVRLGRGGGFYDRFLENYKGLKLGVTFNEVLTEGALPREAHDQLMDIVISPEFWIEVNTREDEVKNGI